MTEQPTGAALSLQQFQNAVAVASGLYFIQEKRLAGEEVGGLIQRYVQSAVVAARKAIRIQPPAVRPSVPEYAPAAPQEREEDLLTTLLAVPLRQAREVFEVAYLSRQLQRHKGNISATADFVRMERSALCRKLRLIGVDAPSLRQPGRNRRPKVS